MSSFDIKAFEDFCRSKPADEEYEFDSTRGCAMCQFLHSSGFPRATVDFESWFDGVRAHDLPKVLQGTEPGSYFANTIGVSPVGELPHTFGALADRLAKLREEQSA